MKIIAIILGLTILLGSCSVPKKLGSNETTYLIKKIKKQNTWYIIYAEKNNTLFKIVSKADNSYDNCNQLKVGKRYMINLSSRKENAPDIGGVKLDPVGYTGCYKYDSETVICLEPKKGINDLFYTNEIKGICFLK